MNDPARLHGGLVARSDRAVYRRLAEGEGAVLLNLDTAAYHGVNDLGALIWEHLSAPMTLDGLLASLEAELSGTPPVWRDDVCAFVEALVDRDLLALVTDGGTRREHSP